MQGLMNAFGDPVQRQPVANEVLDRERAAENQPGGLLLKIDRGAIGAKYRAFLLADVGAGKLHPFLVGSLGEQKNAAARPRAVHGLIGQSGSGGGYIPLTPFKGGMSIPPSPFKGGMNTRPSPFKGEVRRAGSGT